MDIRRARVAAALALAIGLGSGAPALAQAPDARPERPNAQAVESRIVNVNEHVIQLDDGTVVRIPEGLAAKDNLRAGRVVKLTYEASGPENVATSVEFLDEERRK
jgi:hypothetical protein